MNDRMTMRPERGPRAALISPDPTFRSLIAACLEECAPSVEWVLRAESNVAELRPESVDRLAERDPELLFLDVGSQPSAAVRFISAITTLLPGLTVVAAGGDLGVDELLELIRAGASGYLRRPWSRDEATEVCSNVLRKMPSKDDEQPTEPDASHVIALFAPKGGTGVSTLAANLAVHIRSATSKATLLVDLSPELGTCTALLGVEPRYSYLDVLASLHRMDERLFYTFLEEHESGTRILASPASALMARDLTAENVSSLLRLVRRYFPYVVVDTGRSTADEAVLRALDLAEDRLLVTTAELPALRNVKQVLPHLPRADDPTDGPVRLIVNRYEEGLSVPTTEIERAVGLPLFKVLEEDHERVGRSVNLGQPIVTNSSSRYGRSVASLGDRLARADVPVRRRRSALGGLLRRVLPTFGRKNGTASSVNGRPHVEKEPPSAHKTSQRSGGSRTPSQRVR